jgi:predicted ribosome quality control (RQC) complex YloA/Tae2 family protein
VYTDWLLVRRLAWEIENRFAGARVRDVGRLSDGRLGIALWHRRQSELLCIDVFAGTPNVTVEQGELPIAVEPGFVRAAGAVLRGTVLQGARARNGDRLIRLDFGSRSRFGVEDGYALICELVPRFGNIVLAKRNTAEPGAEIIVAAAKEFGPLQNAVRSVTAGDSYEPPPLRRAKMTPLLEEAAAEALAAGEPHGDLFVYRRAGKLVQAHLTALPQFADLPCSRSGSLLDLLAEARREGGPAGEAHAAAQRRRGLESLLAKREQTLRAELTRIDAALRSGEERDALREEGESIYATLHEASAADRQRRKAKAAALFERYKKSATQSVHLRRRRQEMETALADLADLHWELERAADADLAELAQAIAPADSGRPPEARKRLSKKRKPLQFAAPGGSRIIVGRTPLENADVTFRIARPGDLWFHVQGQPGAHVVLQRDDKTPPPREDILAAASIAAFHSKAKESPKVAVDYTQRKHVRKRPAAAPGLVFYTHPKSVLVSPAIAPPSPPPPTALGRASPHTPAS